MARTKKAARKITTGKTAAKRTAAKRTTTRRASPKRSASRRVSATSAGDMFNPSGWFSSLIGSQTGRVIMAEALVAAAGAAAAVLVASQTETGAKAGRALMKAGRDGTEVMKEAARSAAVAAGDVIATMTSDAIGSLATDKFGSTAGQVVDAVAKKIISGKDRGRETQHDLAEKAMRLRERNQPH